MLLASCALTQYILNTEYPLHDMFLTQVCLTRNVHNTHVLNTV